MKITLLSSLVLSVSCKKEESPVSNSPTVSCISDIVDDKIYKLDNRTYLWASPDSSKHFDITGWSLDVCSLHDYGFERESIKALRAPTYIPAIEVSSNYPDTEQVILLKGENRTNIYPYQILAYHEVVNDVIDGKPVMIAYCILANLAAVYSREYCGKELTFGVSGYTYSDEFIWDGVDAFVLWDRETESLWWPLIDAGVSGLMNTVSLRKHTSEAWSYSTWGAALEAYPDAFVIETQQEDEEPENWIIYDCEDLDCCN